MTRGSDTQARAVPYRDLAEFLIGRPFQIEACSSRWFLVVQMAAPCSAWRAAAGNGSPARRIARRKAIRRGGLEAVAGGHRAVGLSDLPDRRLNPSSDLFVISEIPLG